MDGILLIHSEGSYVRGTTPLVGWLKPPMLAARFAQWLPSGAQVHPAFNSNEPASASAMDDSNAGALCERITTSEPIPVEADREPFCPSAGAFFGHRDAQREMDM